MSYIVSINSKDQKHFKSCNFKNFAKDNGLITHEMESGDNDTLFRWARANYTLDLQFLTQTQLTEIINELIVSNAGNGTITLDYYKLAKAGRLDFGRNVGVDPVFRIDPTKFKTTRIQGTNFWNLKMNLQEYLDKDEFIGG